MSSTESSADVARRGIAIVIDEIAGRGGDARPSPRPGGRNWLEVVSPSSRSLVYVKTRRRGDWQTTIERGGPRDAEPQPAEFWVFVDLTESPVSFRVIPAWWIENDIYETHEAYLKRHGGRRAQTPHSTHHGIGSDRVEQWRDRWDLLRLA